MELITVASSLELLVLLEVHIAVPETVEVSPVSYSVLIHHSLWSEAVNYIFILLQHKNYVGILLQKENA